MGDVKNCGSPAVHSKHYQSVLKLATMNIHEARLKVHGTIVDVLVEMAAEDDSDIDALEEEMGYLADVLLEELGLDIISVDKENKMTATLVLYDGSDNP